jgi:hypothetical protein
MSERCEVGVTVAFRVAKVLDMSPHHVLAERRVSGEQPLRAGRGEEGDVPEDGSAPSREIVRRSHRRAELEVGDVSVGTGAEDERQHVRRVDVRRSGCLPCGLASHVVGSTFETARPIVTLPTNHRPPTWARSEPATSHAYRDATTSQARDGTTTTPMPT